MGSQSRSSKWQAILTRCYLNKNNFEQIPVEYEAISVLPQAEKIPKSFPCEEYVIKAQVLAGGRGKGHFDNGFKVQNLVGGEDSYCKATFKGGVHLTKDPSVVAGLCNAMIGNKLITKQTPPEGIPVSKVGS